MWAREQTSSSVFGEVMPESSVEGGRWEGWRWDPACDVR